MILNSLKIAFRTFWKQRTYTTINILGLSIGIACFIVIISFANNELSFDRHHNDAENIYRLKLKGEMSGTFFEAAVAGGQVAKVVYDELPEVVQFARLIDIPRDVLFSVGEKDIYQDHIIYADSTFFDIFKYEFLAGDPSTALDNPYSLVLTESTARKYFGNSNPIEELIQWNNGMEYTVKGVIKEPVPSSHIKFEVLVSRASLYSSSRYDYIYNSLYAFTNLNYIRLDRSYPYDEINTKVKETIKMAMKEGLDNMEGYLEIDLQPIKDIHLNSNLLHEIEQNGNQSVVYIFIGIAVLIIIISIINYVNLSIACSTGRATEVGIRKVYGASKRLLFRQFVGESVLITILSFGVALLLMEFLNPIFSKISDRPIQILLYKNSIYWVFACLLIPFIGFLAGSYPSVYLSLLKPIRVLKGGFFKNSKRSYFRDSMIAIQFIISIFLICSTWLIFNQIKYLNSKDLGFEKDQIIVASLRNRDMMIQYETLKNELLGVPGVIDVTGSSGYLGSLNQRRGFYKEGYTRRDMMMLLNLQTDYNFFETYDLELLDGRYFIDNSESEQNKILINETLARELSLKDPIGEKLIIPTGESETDDPRLEIIGVLKDFHFASLHNVVKPILIWQDPNSIRFVSVRIDGVNLDNTMEMIGDTWQDIFKDYPFDYFFLSDKYASLYKSDHKVGNVFSAFTILALLIAGLGLFGLTSYIIEKRTKEIGIRKVLGSGIPSIMKLISKEFVWLIIISAVLAIPISWYAMNKWLENFAYKVEIHWWVFALSPLLALMFSLITINSRIIVAARKNPVDAIRYE